MVRTRTNILIENDYIERIKEQYGVRSKTEAVDLALRRLAVIPMTLDEALAMDLRKPQDYFQRVWSTAFRAADLATPANEPDSEAPGEEPEEGCA
jgi:Arc/MetJ family transcription regulator